MVTQQEATTKDRERVKACYVLQFTGKNGLTLGPGSECIQILNLKMIPVVVQMLP